MIGLSLLRHCCARPVAAKQKCPDDCCRGVPVDLHGILLSLQEASGESLALSGVS
jgi:hypothetical protein